MDFPTYYFVLLGFIAMTGTLLLVVSFLLGLLLYPITSFMRNL